MNGQPFTTGTIPFGATVDVTRGAVVLDAERGHAEGHRRGRRSRPRSCSRRGTDSGKPVVELRLAKGDFSTCRSAPSGARAPAATIVRQVWGDGKGHFRTKGRYASATVRGTRWLTADRCDGTLMRVQRGVIARERLPEPPPGHPAAGRTTSPGRNGAAQSRLALPGEALAQPLALVARQRPVGQRRPHRRGRPAARPGADAELVRVRPHAHRLPPGAVLGEREPSHHRSPPQQHPVVLGDVALVEAPYMGRRIQPAWRKSEGVLHEPSTIAKYALATSLERPSQLRVAVWRSPPGRTSAVPRASCGKPASLGTARE